MSQEHRSKLQHIYDRYGIWGVRAYFIGTMVISFGYGIYLRGHILYMDANIARLRVCRWVLERILERR